MNRNPRLSNVAATCAREHDHARRPNLGISFLTVLAVLGSAPARAQSTRADQRTSESARVPLIESEITWDVREGESSLLVRVTAAGLNAHEPPHLFLDSWGGWMSRGDAYVVGLQGTPPVERDPGSARFTVSMPATWDGRVTVSYAIPVKAERGLLPWSDGQSLSFFTNNALMDLHDRTGQVRGRRRVTIRAPKNRTIMSGWAGEAVGSQTVDLDHPIDKSPVVIGTPRASSRSERDAIRFEVVQFGSGPDLTQSVLRVSEAVVPAYARNTLRAPTAPVRIIMLEQARGGTHTAHGCLIGYNPAADPKNPNPWFAHFLAHELFHDWLGGYLCGSESITWFHEGFTDYLSLWHLTAAAVVTPEWMAERLSALADEALLSKAAGKVAFADTAGGWRDRDGPRETLAYKGGALLAFAADVELRRAGKPGLLRIVSDLAKTVKGEVTLGDVREWMEANGLAGFYTRHVATPELPDCRVLLTTIGFETYEAEADLTYLGIRLVDGPNIGRVAEIDPDGPAARLDIRVGDSLLGYFPSRSHRPRVSDSVTTRFRFGLDRLKPGVGGAYVEVVRGGKEIQVPITPQLIPGGRFDRFKADPKKVASFLSYERPK
jgi:predicted metalloprotease with PDZ domain